MNAEIKRYLATIGQRGGASTSEAKASAVRVNGTQGGRPRKDGTPAGSKPLEVMIHAIESSGLPKGMKADLRMRAQANASRYRDGRAFMLRNEVVQVEEVLRRWKSKG